jgi:hypothetical protein
MKFPINAPVLIHVFTFLCASTSPKESLRVKSAPPLKPLYKKVSFNGGTNYASEKDVTEFDAAKKAGVIFRVHLETVSEKRGIRIIIRKSLGVATVLVDICSHVDRSVKTESVKLRRWWRGDLLVDLLSGLQRGGEEPNQDCC